MQNTTQANIEQLTYQELQAIISALKLCISVETKRNMDNAQLSIICDKLTILMENTDKQVTLTTDM